MVMVVMVGWWRCTYDLMKDSYLTNQLQLTLNIWYGYPDCHSSSQFLLHTLYLELCVYSDIVLLHALLLGGSSQGSVCCWGSFHTLSGGIQHTGVICTLLSARVPCSQAWGIQWIASTCVCLVQCFDCFSAVSIWLWQEERLWCSTTKSWRVG